MFERNEIFHARAQQRIAAAMTVKMKWSENIGTIRLSLEWWMDYIWSGSRKVFCDFSRAFMRVQNR